MLVAHPDSDCRILFLMNIFYFRMESESTESVSRRLLLTQCHLRVVDRWSFRSSESESCHHRSRGPMKSFRRQRLSVQPPAPRANGSSVEPLGGHSGAARKGKQTTIQLASSSRIFMEFSSSPSSRIKLSAYIVGEKREIGNNGKSLQATCSWGRAKGRPSHSHTAPIA